MAHREQGDRHVRATARVSVTVEVEVGTWGSDCSVGQVLRQAEEEAVQKVRNAFAQAGATDDVDFKVLRADVAMVVTEEQR